MITTVVFDLGGVLIDWNPRYLYSKLIKDPAKIEAFIANITTGEWNAQMDAGKPFAEGVRELIAQHPEQAEMIAAYHTRWGEMLGGAIDGTVEILHAVKKRGYRLLGLSNWSAETFPIALDRFKFLHEFETILVSGQEKLIKPDPKFYQLLETRLHVKPNEAVFIDDVQKNIDAARALGFATILFKSPDQLRTEMRALGLTV